MKILTSLVHAIVHRIKDDHKSFEVNVVNDKTRMLSDFNVSNLLAMEIFKRFRFKLNEIESLFET